jgi:hypothetical protein
MKDKTTVLATALAVAFAIAVLAQLFMTKEGFAQQSIGAPVGDSMGSYGGINLSTEENLWSSQPKPTPLKPYEAADDNNLFQYQESKFTPECCPSSITNDVGCLCPTAQEKKDWSTRGGNRVSDAPDVLT